MQECHKKCTFQNLGDYCDWAIKIKHTIQIAHNLKGYDGVFILKYFFEIYYLVKVRQKFY